jgi:hypothetical protein
MKKTFQKRMGEAFDNCPGAVMGDLPTSEQAQGNIIVEPSCSKAALTFLRRRFYVEESVGIETTGELRFVIKPRVRRAPGKPKPRVEFRKQIQYELPL